jgi:hypothetical protein
MSGGNVRYWPKADIGECTAHVCFSPKADMVAPRLQIAVYPYNP